MSVVEHIHVGAIGLMPMHYGMYAKCILAYSLGDTEAFSCAKKDLLWWLSL